MDRINRVIFKIKSNEMNKIYDVSSGTVAGWIIPASIV
jgi:hypothetical protein